MTLQNNRNIELKYKDFVLFMKRYERDNKRQKLKEKYVNPYKYRKVFNKDKKHGS